MCATDLYGRDVRQAGQVLRVGHRGDELDGGHTGAGWTAVGVGHAGGGGAGWVGSAVVE